MSNSKDNPCNGCSTNQHCCSQLSGLFLAEEEYDQHFKKHAAKLDVVWSNKFVVVSVAQGGPCPYWGKDGCLIYHYRPIDCRAFPYVTTQIVEKRNRIIITFHSSSDCPKRDSLYRLMPEAEVRKLLMVFGKKTFGENKTVIVRHADEITSRLSHRFKAAISRQWRKIRHH
jgi:Fe-S-cluster containining protein